MIHNDRHNFFSYIEKGLEAKEDMNRTETGLTNLRRTDKEQKQIIQDTCCSINRSCFHTIRWQSLLGVVICG
jgi:hypothetical protein